MRFNKSQRRAAPVALALGAMLACGAAAHATTTVVNYDADGPSAMAYSGVNSQTYWELGGSLDSSTKFIDLGNSGFSSATGGIPSPADYNVKNEKLWVYVLHQGQNGQSGTDSVVGGALTQVDADQQYLAGLISIGTFNPSFLPGTPYPEGPTENIRKFGRSIQPLQGFSETGTAPTAHQGTFTTTIPTPEPSAVGLLLLGAGALLLARRRGKLAG